MSTIHRTCNLCEKDLDPKHFNTIYMDHQEGFPPTPYCDDCAEDVLEGIWAQRELNYKALARSKEAARWVGMSHWKLAGRESM